MSIVLLFGTLAGCTSTKYVSVRQLSQNPLTEQLSLTSGSGPKPSERTQQFLRRYDLVQMAEGDPKKLLARIHTILKEDPSPEGCQAFAEMSYISGFNAEKKNAKTAIDFYGASVAHCYYYLFDPRIAQFRNPYDSQFRDACNLYNQSLQSALKLVQKNKPLRVDMTTTIELADQTWDISIGIGSGPWKPEEFDHFEFASDFEVTGLQNVYRTYGLGVPLIAVRKKQSPERLGENYYPPELSFAMTAFLRLMPDETGSAAHQSPQAGTTCKRHRAVLELYDPLTSKDIVIGDRMVPLETDLSTPLAYFLSNPVLSKTDYGTLGLIQGEATAKYSGLYMLEPYQPHKVPVIFVHGLWSSPMTWMEMYNDLQGSPDIRSKYQFWFYLYPTGQPFWYSAAKMRNKLEEVRQTFDAEHKIPAMDKMVLVGHSMGGLVSKLQAVNSNDDFWHMASDKPFSELKGSDEVREKVREIFYFNANPSIGRVITIGTPHRGSNQSNSYTQWFADQIINLPSMLTTNKNEVLRDNPTLFRNTAFMSINTSVDSLSPKSPFWNVLLKAERPPTVKYHNIVGVVPHTGVNSLFPKGDTIVPFESAHLDRERDGITSELEVNADHSSVHRHPRSVMAVRDILRDHADTFNFSGPEVLQTNYIAPVDPKAMSNATGYKEPYLDYWTTQSPTYNRDSIPTPETSKEEQIPPTQSTLQPTGQTTVHTEGQTNAQSTEPAPLSPTTQTTATRPNYPPGMIPMSDRPAGVPVRR